MPTDPVVIEIEPEKYSQAEFRAFVERMLARPESTLESLGAAKVLREIRADAGPLE